MPTTTRAPRNSLSRARVVVGAVELADAHGLDALTMRSLATHLQVRPMSLYRHVADKGALLDAMVEQLYADMERPDPTAPGWRDQLRRRSASVRATLVAHPWALGLLESRTGPDRPFTFEHAEAVLATLLNAGFSPRLASRAFVALDSLVYGFAVQEITMPSTDPHHDPVDHVPAQVEGRPSLSAVMDAVLAEPGYDLAGEFDACLDLVLDGIDRWRVAGAGVTDRPPRRPRS